MEPEVLKFKECPRCGKTHDALVIKPFLKPPVPIELFYWTYWATCPNTKEPIFIKPGESLLAHLSMAC